MVKGASLLPARLSRAWGKGAQKAKERCVVGESTGVMFLYRCSGFSSCKERLW